METMIVTGGAGFIGSNFVRHALAETPDRIVVVDKLTYAGNLESLADAATHPRYAFVRADIADREAMRAVFRDHRPTSVVNFAAETHVDRSIDDPSAFIRTNVAGTFELLEAARLHLAEAADDARRSFRFLHVSTDEVYGSLGAEGAFSETTPYAPNSPYAASKAAADHLVRAYHETYGLPALITNCSNNYGPYQFPEKLIPLVIVNAVEGKPASHLRRRWQRPGLALRRRPLRRHPPRAAQGTGRRQVQHRRPQRAQQPGGRRPHLRDPGAGKAGGREPGARRPGPPHLRGAQDLREGPARPRPPLRHRRHQDRDGAGLAPGARVRGGDRPDRALVSRQPGWCESVLSGKYRRERLGLKQ